MADWQHTREQFGFSGVREPTHWIITTFFHALTFEGSSSIIASSSSWVVTAGCRPSKYSLGTVGQRAGSQNGNSVIDLPVEHLRSHLDARLEHSGDARVIDNDGALGDSYALMLSPFDL